MKTKILITFLFLLFDLFTFAQTVPNTTTFTLQQVVDAVNPSSYNLSECFADAVSGYFNPAYSGSKNSLLNFQDYGPHNAQCLTLPSVTQLSYTGTKTQTSIDVTTAASSVCPILSRIIYYSSTHIATQSDTPFAQANTSGSITTTVTGLAANTGYYFSVYVVTNSYNTSFIQQTFKYYTSP